MGSGQVWHGLVRYGKAMYGMARLGLVGQGELMKQISVEIRGITPLLIHRFSEQSETESKTRKIEVSNRDPREEARKVAYINPDGTFYFSAFSIPGSMANAGTNHKVRGSRKSLRFVVPSAVSVETDAITIMNGDGPAKDFEVDSRPVTIPATKGRIMRHRPRFNCWGAQFILFVDDSLLSIESAHQLLTEAGMSYGIGDFRPEKRGPFGRFRVTKFEEVK